jgi:hypothetical protein
MVGDAMVGAAACARPKEAAAASRAKTVFMAVGEGRWVVIEMRRVRRRRERSKLKK